MVIESVIVFATSALDELLVYSVIDEVGPSAIQGWAFTLLAHERRRFVLYLLEKKRTRSVEELADRIAAQESGTPEAEVPEAQRHRIATSLIHSHLPKLADHGIVDYDARSGDVVLCERAGELEPILDVAKEYDDLADEWDSTRE